VSVNNNQENLIRLNNRLFAIGDIHGCFNALRNLIETKIILTNTDKIILLGDYIDRGSNSKEVVDYIITLIEKGFDIIPLMGNHESILLEVLENDDYLAKWIRNGGTETMNSFGIKSIKQLSNRYIVFFKGLRPYYSFDNFLFVHAGFNDTCENPFNDTYEMLWSRNQVYSHPLLSGKTIIHGHTPVTVEQCRQSVNKRMQNISIDTGCVYSNRPGFGRLTALELFSCKLYSV
jgi:serine/threonine protein phosphatase 1